MAMPTPTPDVPAPPPPGTQISTLRSDHLTPPPANLGSGELPCPRCHESNPIESRFCHACGFALAGPPPQTPAVIARPIAPAVVQANPPPAVAIVCGRCRGVADPGADFCKFCGARLTPNAPPAEPPTANSDVGRRSPEPMTPSPMGPSPASHLAPSAAALSPRGEAGRAGGDLATPSAMSAPSSHRLMNATKPHHGIGELAMRGKLVRIAKDGSEGVHHPIVNEQTDIGRAEGNIVLPDDPYLSPRHARIVARPSGLFLIDLGSVNGTFMRLRTPHPLAHGDLLLLGQQVLRFEAVSELEGARGPAMQHGVLLFGSPAPVARARLAQRTVEGLVRDVLYLVRDEVTVGREMGDRTFPEDVFMSRRHAVIRREGGNYVLHDLGSSNGTFMQVHGEHALQDADQFRIGHHLFRVDIGPGGDPARGQPVGGA